MKKNMGAIDRILRAIIAVLIGILYATNVINGTLGIILLVLAAVFLITAIIGVCPLYMPFRLSTVPKKENPIS